MGLFGFGKKHVAAEIAGHNLTALVIDADDCWRDVCEMRGYSTSGPVATCEMAFARAGIARALFREHSSNAVADRMLTASKALVVDAFSGEDTDETLAFYSGPMDEMGLMVMHVYETIAWDPAQWASKIGSRLGVPGPASIELAHIAERQHERVKGLLSKIKIV